MHTLEIHLVMLKCFVASHNVGLGLMFLAEANLGLIVPVCLQYVLNQLNGGTFCVWSKTKKCR